MVIMAFVNPLMTVATSKNPEYFADIFLINEQLLKIIEELLFKAKPTIHLHIF